MPDYPEGVRDHWSKLFPTFQAATLDFYARLEGAIRERNIPNTVVERVEYREGGAFSGIRQYLRVRRRREVFDICAAPFGDDFFFSWWCTELRPSFPSAVSIAVVFGYLAVLGYAVYKIGVLKGPIALVLLVPLALFFLSRLGDPDVDDFVMRLPGIGLLYERFFNPITYYRIDTSEMFQHAVKQVVMAAINDTTAPHGIRALAEDDWKTVMHKSARK